MKEYYSKHPESKAEADRFNIELSHLIKSGKVDYYKNQIYEIPIVVHFISDGSSIGSNNNRSDQQIIDWINYTNQIFAGTAPNILNEANGGTVFL